VEDISHPVQGLVFEEKMAVVYREILSEGASPAEKLVIGA
jgi:hypothetical protein